MISGCDFAVSSSSSEVLATSISNHIADLCGIPSLGIEIRVTAGTGASKIYY
jgi:hypothetical protein